ncbi:MAG TPA: WD40 repeat domain-containing protein [Blastocatellia bacterium]|nr:WD40 repeat domain-containing protein [Blastocatellia bacterium]
MSESLARKIILVLGVILWLAAIARAQTSDEGTDALLAKFKPPDHRIRHVAFSPDGRLLAAGYGFTDEGGVRIWRISDRSVVATLLEGTKEQAGIKRIAFSSNGKLFAAANENGDVMLWAVGAWRSHTTVLRRRGSPMDLSFSPTGTKLAFSSDEVALLYDLKSTLVSLLATKATPGDSFTGISFAPDGNVVAVCGRREIWLWDVEREKRLIAWESKSFSFFGRLSPDGKYLIAGGGPVFGKKSVQIWNVNEKKRIAELSEFKGGLFSLAISHSGKLFAVAGGDYAESGNLSLWNVEDASEIGFVSFGKYPIQCLAFNSDDSILAAGSEDGFVLLYAVDRIRGPVLKKQTSALCGEIMVEGDRAFMVPLAKVPMPMRDFEYPWKLEITNADSVAGVAGSPVVLRDWSIESNAAADRVMIREFQSLLWRSPSPMNSDYAIIGYVQNPGWNEGFVAKIYGDGSFVATDNSGKCRAYGSLVQLKTDFESVRKRLVSEGLIDIAKNPLTLGADHYGTRFIELTINGVPELRSDADNVAVLLKGGPAKKRESFSRVFNQEEAFINSILNSGMKAPPN